MPWQQLNCERLQAMARLNHNVEEWRAWKIAVETIDHGGEARDLPEENLPEKRTGEPPESGTSKGWPSRMLKPATVAAMHNEGITKTSQILQLADCMTEDQFRGFIEGHKNPIDEYHQLNHSVLITWLEREDTLDEYQRRTPGGAGCTWRGQHCHANNSILRPYLTSSQECWDGEPQGQKIARAIEANTTQYAAWRRENSRQLSAEQLTDIRNANQPPRP
jgi:hypothetical protein